MGERGICGCVNIKEAQGVHCEKGNRSLFDFEGAAVKGTASVATLYLHITCAGISEKPGGWLTGLIIRGKEWKCRKRHKEKGKKEYKI